MVVPRNNSPSDKVQFPALSKTELKPFIMSARSAFVLIKNGKELEAKRNFPEQYTFVKTYSDMSVDMFTAYCAEKMDSI